MCSTLLASPRFVDQRARYEVVATLLDAQANGLCIEQRGDDLVSGSLADESTGGEQRCAHQLEHSDSLHQARAGVGHRAAGARDVVLGRSLEGGS